MTKAHGLRRLQVCKTGHDGIGFATSQRHQPLLQSGQLAADSADFIAQVKANVGGNLIVARTTGVQLLAGDADLVRQPRLDIHVHVFQAHRPLKATVLDLAADLFQARLNLLQLVFAQHTHFGQHRRVRQRTIDIVVVKALIETDGGSKALNKLIGGFSEASTPGFDGRLLVTHCKAGPVSVGRVASTL